MAMAVEIIIHWRKLAKANRHWHRFTKKAKPAYFHGYPQWTRNKKPPQTKELWHLWRWAKKSAFSSFRKRSTIMACGKLFFEVLCLDAENTLKSGHNGFKCVATPSAKWRHVLQRVDFEAKTSLNLAPRIARW